jgi:hypothetical protein
MERTFFVRSVQHVKNPPGDQSRRRPHPQETDMLLSYSEIATLFGIVYGPFLLILIVHVGGWLNEKRRDWIDSRAEARAAMRTAAPARAAHHLSPALAGAEA